MTLKLFYAPGACSLASHIALEEAGADYEIVRVDFARGEQREAGYLAVNPKGRVPALATDWGVLTENVAILAYVAQAYPQANLAPIGDPAAFAQVQAFNSYLASTVHVAFSHIRRGNRWADDPAAIAEMKRKAPEAIADCFQLIENQLLKGPYVMGPDYGISDSYLYVFENWLGRDGVDINRFPKVKAHYERVGARPAVAKAVAQEKA